MRTLTRNRYRHDFGKGWSGIPLLLPASPVFNLDLRGHRPVFHLSKGMNLPRYDRPKPDRSPFHDTVLEIHDDTPVIGAHISAWDDVGTWKARCSGDRSRIAGPSLGLYGHPRNRLPPGHASSVLGRVRNVRLAVPPASSLGRNSSTKDSDDVNTRAKTTQL